MKLVTHRPSIGRNCVKNKNNINICFLYYKIDHLTNPPYKNYHLICEQTAKTKDMVPMHQFFAILDICLLLRKYLMSKTENKNLGTLFN